MKNILYTLVLLISFNSFGQLNLGDKVTYTRGEIAFTIKKPEPYIESDNTYGANGTTLVKSFFSKQNLSIIQIHSNPIPKNYKNYMNQLMEDSEMAKELFERKIFPPPMNKILSYRKILINSKPFYEVEYIIRNIEKQIAWITVYKNRFININSTTTIGNFDNLKGFLNDFKEHIELE